MGKYGAYFSAFATTTAAKTAINIYANAAKERGEVIELIMTGGGTVTPADIGHQARFTGLTEAGTGTGTILTATPFNPQSAAGTLQVIGSESAEPTTVVVANYPLMWGFNQRGGMRWAVPQGEGFTVMNADTNPGYVFQVISSAVGTVDGSANFWEP